LSALPRLLLAALVLIGLLAALLLLAGLLTAALLLLARTRIVGLLTWILILVRIVRHSHLLEVQVITPGP
jgi:hypothetical protein